MTLHYESAYVEPNAMPREPNEYEYDAGHEARQAAARGAPSASSGPPPPVLRASKTADQRAWQEQVGQPKPQGPTRKAPEPLPRSKRPEEPIDENPYEEPKPQSLTRKGGMKRK